MRAPGLRVESAMKIIHTADWQLGKPFARFEPDVRAALTEARFDAIDAIGRHAQAHEINHVLVAGDIFDTEGPEDRTVVQALSRMERQASSQSADRPVLRRPHECRGIRPHLPC